VGSEAAPNYERGRTIPGPTNPTASQPPPSSADTSVRWDFPCPATWQGLSEGSGRGGTYRGSRGAAPGRGRGTDGPRGVQGKAPRAERQFHLPTRSITGHVTAAMTEHYSHVGREEKLAAAGSIVRMVMGTNTEGKSGGSGGGSEAHRPDDTRSIGPNLPN
jgi:hypothetical protein